MPSILEIQQEAQDVVRFSTVGLGTLNKLKLDTITYNIVDKDGAVKRSYVGRNKRQAAYDDADNSNFAEEEGAPFHVEAKSNLGIDSQTGALDFVVGSQVGILFPTDEINAAADAITAAVDCAIIEDMIKREIQALVDQLLTKATAAGDLSPFSALASIPSNPLKIISWVRKFVSMYLGPQILAMIDLAIQLAQLAAAVQKITQAASAAQKNITLCAASGVDTAIDSLIESSTAALGTTTTEINSILSTVSEVQSKISNITGKPAKFQTGSIEQLIESATTENRAAFISDVNEYATASLSEAEATLSANTVSSIFTAGGAFAGNTAVPGDSSSGTNGEFEIITGKGSFDQVRYTVRNGIIANVVVGL
jgi:hypothetical protein